MVKLKTPKTISPIIIAAKLIIQVINSVNNIKTTNKSIKMCFFSRVATKLQSAYVLAKGGRAVVC
jgi:hypothetical protein